MYLDLKVTVWERMHFDSEEQMKDVIAKLESGEFTNADEVTDYVGKGTETLHDTNTTMVDIEDNDGFSTLEIYDSENELVYSNGKT